MNFEEFEELSKRYREKKEEEASAEDLDFGVKVIIDNMVYQKIMHWVNKSNFEVSGLGKVIYDRETNTLRVTDAYLLPQRNTTTSTDIDPNAIARLMYQTREAPGDLRFWWHSHVNMPVFWSGTDIATLKQLGSGGWFCATVFNKRNETKSAFCQNTPIRLLLSDVETQIAHPANDELIRQWNEEYETKVENIEYSFRDSRFIKEDEETEEKETKINSQEEKAAEEASQWEKIVDAEGRTFSFKKNLVPVSKKKSTSIDEETGQIDFSEIEKDFNSWLNGENVEFERLDEENDGSLGLTKFPENDND